MQTAGQRLTERFADPLGGLAREKQPAPCKQPLMGPAKRTPVRGTRIASRPMKPVDRDHERRVHEELMRERDAGFTDGAKMLIAVGVLATLALRGWLGLDLGLTLQAFLYSIPVLGTLGLILHQARHVLPAFSDSGAAMVIVALVVGIGAFALFFQDGTMGRLKAGGREGRPVASPVTPR